MVDNTGTDGRRRDVSAASATSTGRTRSAIGAQVRAAREERGLTLKALADSMDVTPSLLSQIETDKALPSLNTLYRLALNLGLSIDSLLDLPSEADGARREPAAVPASRPAVPAIQRVADNPTLEMTNGVRWERLAGGGAEGVEVLRITYAPHASSSHDGTLMRHGGVEYGVLLSGTLSITLAFETHVLAPGDSVHFDTSTPHVYRNDSDEDASGIWFTLRGGVPPSSAAAGMSALSGLDGRKLIDVLKALDPTEDW